MQYEIENLAIDSAIVTEHDGDHLFLSPEIALNRRLSFAEDAHVALNRPYLIPQWRCIHVLNGAATYVVNLRTVDVTAGDTVVFPQNSVIELIRVTSAYCISGVSTRWIPAPERLFVPGGEFATEIHALLDTLWSAVHHQPLRTEYVKALVTALHWLLRTAAVPETADEAGHGRRATQLVRKFIGLLATDAAIHRRITHYAEALRISPGYLSSIVKTETGRSAADWIDQAVIQEAKLRLRYSDCTITETAYDLKFANPAFFNKYFKRLTGMTPLAYKRSCRTDRAAK